MEKKKRIRRTREQLIADGYYKEKAEKAKQPQKRHRRTRAELIASGYYKDKTIKESPKVKEVVKHSRDKYKISQSKEEPKSNIIEPSDIPVEHSVDLVENVLNKKVKSSDKGFKSLSMTAETLSERQIQKAKERGDDNWEKDLRNDYERGNIVYYVELNPYCHTKEVIDCRVRTVYAKSMICSIEDGECRVIGIEDIDNIFITKKDAIHYCKKVQI